jgi:ABC-type transport system involved in multi-copper enzyme maturation permease subunit
MNAIFERDFLAFGASARFQVCRFLVAAAMGGALLLLVTRAYANDSFRSIGSTIFALSIGAGAAIVVAIVPGSFSTVLVHARAGSTLPVLLTTPLSPFGIAAGAFAARTASFVVLLVATWPPIAVSLLFGGAPVERMFAATAAVLATGLCVAAPSFVASAFSRRTASAVVAAYLAAVALLAGLWVVAPTAGGPGGLWDGAAVSPIHALLASSDTTTPPATPADAFAPYLLLAWTATLSLAAVLLVAWRLSREGRGTADAARIASLSGRECRPLRRKNPLLDRETRGTVLTGGTGRGLLAVLLAVEIAFLLIASARSEWTSLPLHFAVLAMQIFLVLLAVVAAGATSLAVEREGRTLDLLRVTPLTPREIVIAKLAGLLHAYAPCLAVPLAHLVLASALGVFSIAAVPLCALTGALAMSAWAVFGLSQSLDQPNPSRAVVRTMGAFAIVAVLIAANIGFPVEGIFSNTDDWIRRAAAFAGNPVALTLLPAAALRTGGSDATRTFVPPPGNGDLAFAAAFALAWAALYAFAGYSMYRRLFHTYRTRVDG